MAREGAPDVFLGAREQLHEMEEHLRSRAAFVDDHAGLESYVRQQGREVERRALQAHLDLRAARERVVEVRGADGVRRTTHRRWARSLLTIVGLVEVRRRAYEAHGVEALLPADAALNLTVDLYSFGVRRLVAEEACKVSFDGVVEQTTKVLGVTVPKRQVEDLTVRAWALTKTDPLALTKTDPPPSRRSSSNSVVVAEAREAGAARTGAGGPRGVEGGDWQLVGAGGKPVDRGGCVTGSRAHGGGGPRVTICKVMARVPGGALGSERRMRGRPGLEAARGGSRRLVAGRAGSERAVGWTRWVVGAEAT
jgi:hypothetical protein